MKTLVYSSHDFEKTFLKNASQGKQKLVYTEQSLDIHSANNAKGFDAVSLFTSDNAMADVLALLKANGIKLITLRSAGHDNVDLAAAEKLGIKIANVPAYSPNSIAEQAVALLMALNRKLLLGQERIKKK